MDVERYTATKTNRVGILIRLSESEAMAVLGILNQIVDLPDITTLAVLRKQLRKVITGSEAREGT